MSTIEESEDDVSNIDPESLPAADISTRWWHFIWKISVQVLDIWIEESKVKENIPEKHVYVKVSSDAGCLQWVKESIEAVEKAALEEFDY